MSSESPLVLTSETAAKDKASRLKLASADASPVKHSLSATALHVAGKYGIVFVLLILVVAGQLVYNQFLTISNLSTILSQNAAVGVVAVGMTFVILAQGFDLSVGGIFALASVIYAGVAQQSSVLTGIAAAIGVGLAAGLINGAVVSRVRVNPFVTTLGSGYVFAGLAYLYATAPIGVNKAGFQLLGTGAIAGIPITIVILVVTTAVATVILWKTVYGRNVFAVGGNLEASRLAGIRVGMTRGSTYLITGGLAALAAVLSVSQLGVAEANVGTTLPLTSIAMVIIGGTSLAGGEGSMWRTVVGFLVISGLSNLLNSLGIASSWQSIATGLILVGAVAVDVLTGRVSLAGYLKRS